MNYRGKPASGFLWILHMFYITFYMFFMGLDIPLYHDALCIINIHFVSAANMLHTGFQWGLGWFIQFDLLSIWINHNLTGHEWEGIKTEAFAKVKIVYTLSPPTIATIAAWESIMQKYNAK